MSRQTKRRIMPQEGGGQTNAPRRSARSTRSQSHELNENDAARPKNPRILRQVSKSPNDDSSRHQVESNRGKTRSRRPKVDQDLSTVEENSVEYPELERVKGNNDAQDELKQAGSLQRSPTATSNISGTTARNSHSFGRARNVGAEDMLDALPDTCEAAEKVMDLLLSDVANRERVLDLLHDLQEPTARKSRKLRRLETVFYAHKESFSSDRLFLDVKSTLNTMLGAEATAAARHPTYRPDNALYKINLADFLLTIIRHRRKAPDLGVIEELEADFPAPFASEFSNAKETGASDGSSDMLAQTFALARKLRIQAAILLLDRDRESPTFDPQAILGRCYFLNSSLKALKGWHVPGLRDKDLTNQQQNDLSNDMKTLQGIFLQDNNSRLSSLEEFSWTSLLTDIIQWAKSRREQIEAGIYDQGDIEVIAENLATELQGRRLDLANPNIDPALVDSNGSVQPRIPSQSTMSPSLSTQDEVGRPMATMFTGLNNAQNAAHLRNLQEALEQAEATTLKDDNAQGQYEGADDWNAPQIEDDMPGADETSADGTDTFIQNVIAYKVMEERANNKENIADAASFENIEDIQPSSSRRALTDQRSFIDRQAGATRVNFDESQIPIASSSSSRQNRKRKGPANDNDNDEDLDVSQDQGFQPHDQETDITARRRAKPVQRSSRVKKNGMGQSPKRARVVALEEGSGGLQISPQQSPSGDRIPPTSTYEAHRKANMQAKIISSMRPNKVAQVRKAWTVEETESLLHLITNHGTSWSSLKEIDAESDKELLSRDQVALKDKARNMKVDFLKVGYDLPTNFEYIPISKIQVDKLEQVGVHYDRSTGTRMG